MENVDKFIANVGLKVKRGRDWEYDNQDSHGIGKIVSIDQLAIGWVDVLWDNGHHNTYRIGGDGSDDWVKYDLSVYLEEGEDEFEEIEI